MKQLTNFSYLIKKQIIFESGGILQLLVCFENNTVQLFDFYSGDFTHEFTFQDFLEKPGERLKEETEKKKDESAMTMEEVQLYDRQIRLWGMEAQAKWASPLFLSPPLSSS